MKNRIILMLISLMALQMPACLPEEDIDPDDPIEKFLGTWKVNESCNRMTYDVDIVQDPGNSAQVLLYNFGNPGAGYDPAVGLVTSNSIHIASQTIGEGWTVSGTGTYHNDGTISWDYTLIIGSSAFDCTATFSK
jgi:hypothetical protein